ncbi:MAG: ATP:cob(I)alamin adenosyltransferase [Patescibacteria group bacterium]
MALFTGKGDNGTTKIFGCDQRISKSSSIAEALGSLDEINSFLGLCKVQAEYLGFGLEGKPLSHIVHDIQKNLFIVQAELAGAEKSINEEKVKELENIINKIETKLPPIKSFFISGGPTNLERGELAGAGLGAIFDIARTIARRAEREVTFAMEAQTMSLFKEGTENGGETTKENIQRGASVATRSYLNRLSSVLYALARYANHLAGISEEAPDYR